MIRICPNCNKTYVVDKNSGDYQHRCNSGNDVMDKEDVSVVGNWVDDNGSSGIIGPQQVMRQGAENKLFGTRPDIEGEDLEDHTRLGNRASTHRQRQHFESIEGVKDGCEGY